WLGEKAEALGVNLFTGFPAASLLTEGVRVADVRTAATGLDREGRPLASHQPPNDIVAKVTVLAEGTRGMLAQAYLEWQHRAAENPQIFALGVKEIWETKRSEEHTSELQSQSNLVCRLLLEKKKKKKKNKHKKQN